MPLVNPASPALELYSLITWLAGREIRRAGQVYTEHLVQHVLEVARRDPGRRVLIAVNVRYCHHIRRALKQHPEVEIVRYLEL